VEKTIRNPYDFINPVKDPKRFAGRKKELEEIRYYLQLSKSDEPRYFHIALVGPRSVGKTSLLNMIEYMANELGLLAVKIPLNKGMVKNEALFFKEVIDSIVTQGKEKDVYSDFFMNFRKVLDLLDVNVGVPLLFGTAYIGFKKGRNTDIPQHVLIHDFRELHKRAKEKGFPAIVLLFDECDLLAENEVLLQKIRNIFVEVEGYLLVFSGTERMFSLLSETFSPISRFFKRINVENFRDIRETEECLLKPLSEEERKFFDRMCIVDIHRLTNGSPYEINLVAHYMYRRWREGKSSKIQLTPEVLDNVLNELESIRKVEKRIITSKIKRYWIDYLKILVLLLEFPNVPEDWFVEYALLDEIETLQSKDAYTRKNVIRDYIGYLKKDGVIAEREGKLIFNGDQFDVVYLKYLCASKGIREPKDFYIGFSDYPLINLHRKLVEAGLLRDFEEYNFQTLFDDIERKNGRIARKFLIGGRAVMPPGEESVLVEISPETRREFYLGAPNSMRFRVNIDWLKTGFVTQIKFKDKESLDRFVNRLNVLKDKLEFLGYKIVLKDEISWNLEGTKYVKEGKVNNALECFNKAIELNPFFELPWFNKASLLFRHKDYELSLECVNKALELHPSWVAALRLKGMILINLRRNKEAVEVLRKAIDIDPEDWSAWDNLGRALFNLRKYEEALECFEKALKINPDNHELYYLKGAVLVQLGRIEVAESTLNEALRLKPDHVPSLMLKAELLFNKGRYEETLEILDKILIKDPKNIEVLLSKGLVLSKLNRYEEAIRCCDAVLRIDNNNTSAWYNKACFTAKLGCVKEALEYLRKALELDSRLMNMAMKDEDLSSLRSHKEFQRLIRSFKQIHMESENRPIQC